MFPRRMHQRLATRVRKAFTDTAVYYAKSSTVDDYGHAQISTTGTYFSCSFTDKVARETWSEYTREDIEFEIRMMDITPAMGGQIKLIARFNEPITNQTFEIIGIRPRGAHGYVCALKRVEL